VHHQAAFIAYMDDFRGMMIATLCILPLVLVLKPGRAHGGGGAHAVMD
jgi:DHA2 family multidrug resistance protein